MYKAALHPGQEIPIHSWWGSAEAGVNQQSTEALTQQSKRSGQEGPGLCVSQRERPWTQPLMQRLSGVTGTMLGRQTGQPCLWHWGGENQGASAVPSLEMAFEGMAESL